MRRGEIWWVSLPEPQGSEPGYSRPMVVIQANDFNRSRINTVIVAVMTSNLKLASAPGNLLIKSKQSGLARDSVINVSQLLTVDKSLLTERMGELNPQHMHQLEEGLRLVLAL